MITPKNIVRHELIGLKVVVEKSKNKSQIGLKGEVVNETKMMLVLKTRNELKRVQKKGTVFIFTLPSGRVRVNGTVIGKRPENRVKQKVRKW